MLIAAELFIYAAGSGKSGANSGQGFGTSTFLEPDPRCGVFDRTAACSGCGAEFSAAAAPLSPEIQRRILRALRAFSQSDT